MAINYVLLADNGKTGGREEYKYCIDSLGEGEFGEKKREGTLWCVLQGKPCCGQYNQCSMQATTARCPHLSAALAKSIHHFEQYRNTPSDKTGVTHT